MYINPSKKCYYIVQLDKDFLKYNKPKILDKLTIDTLIQENEEFKGMLQEAKNQQHKHISKCDNKHLK